MSCSDMLDEYEDAQSLPAMTREKIGEVRIQAGGIDTYYLVKSNEDDITPEQVREWMLPQFYKESGGAGSYFCTYVRAIQDGSNVIAIVQHRYDN